MPPGLTGRDLKAGALKTPIINSNSIKQLYNETKLY